MKKQIELQNPVKRCPTCNRVESDDALVFCRVDGSTLVNPSELGDEAGTAKLGAQSGPNEIGTSILAHLTNADVVRGTGPTTVLSPSVPVMTGALTKPKRRSTAIVIGVAVSALVAIISAVLVNSSKKRDKTINQSP